MLSTIEGWVRTLSLLAALATLTLAIWRGVFQSLRRPAGRSTRAASRVLRVPLLAAATVLWVGACVLLWRPLPLPDSDALRLLGLLLGAPLLLAGLALYLWGSVTLGAMHGPSSGFGVRLLAGHRLVTQGPFAYLRHPLYLGLQVAGLGGLLLYRNWTWAFIFLNMMGLFLRARREEEALALEFGEAWQAYVRRVPRWLPRRKRV